MTSHGINGWHVIIFWFGVFIGIPLLLFAYVTPDKSNRTASQSEGLYPKHCVAFAEELFDERFAEAMADPSLWQVAGDESAYQYADRSRRFYLSRCK